MTTTNMTTLQGKYNWWERRVENSFIRKRK